MRYNKFECENAIDNTDVVFYDLSAVKIKRHRLRYVSAINCLIRTWLDCNTFRIDYGHWANAKWSEHMLCFGRYLLGFRASERHHASEIREFVSSMWVIMTSANREREFRVCGWQMTVNIFQLRVAFIAPIRFCAKLLCSTGNFKCLARVAAAATAAAAHE